MVLCCVADDLNIHIDTCVRSCVFTLLRFELLLYGSHPTNQESQMDFRPENPISTLDQRPCASPIAHVCANLCVRSQRKFRQQHLTD